MNVIFLGTSGTFPNANRGLPAVALRRNGELFLFDCGEGTQRQMIISKLRFSRRMRIFISHMHGDHILGLPGLFQTMSLFDRRAPLKIYGPSGVFDFIRTFKETLNFSLTYPLEVEEVEEGVICREKEYHIQAAWVDHTIPTLAYALKENDRPGIFHPEKARALDIPEGPLWSRIQHEGQITVFNNRVIISSQVMGPPRRGRKVVYSGDTRPCDAILRLAKGADVLIYEATLDDSLSAKADDTGHSTPSQGAEIAKRGGVKRLILTHISGRYINIDDQLKQARRIFPVVDIAGDLMEIEVPYTD